MSDEDDFTRPNPIIGTPLSDSRFFPGQQSEEHSCAVRCQEFIIRQYTGADAPEQLFIDESRAHGWYEDGVGTKPADIGKLLELHGIPVNRYYDAHPLQLAGELFSGHKVIIGVDSYELQHNDHLLRDLGHVFNYGTADHAVVVSGIDTSDRDNVQVIISDPGTGEAAARYPLGQFIDAWRDSHFFMVATQEPPPPEMHLPEFSHFDYAAGHPENVEAWHELQDLYAVDDGHAVGHHHHDPVHHDDSFDTTSFDDRHLDHQSTPYGHDDYSDTHHHDDYGDTHHHDDSFDDGEHHDV